ncbi:NACHT, LRR and PYD domains-containing protein 12-like isoform X1 [Hemibagrus wyckioides]|uniref:NACHT, LRR and PYD domains-containing protein 12-like isoform X1 n=1 Tax=Hemibagrus wyckioides TaxID=337641 RepID=UPI00266BF3A8|nr:NACHT, LRR and PYD domains-containing protein 12-like isoform X1 [Hemibagrus wyckioides]XP_058272980.1 NACHT, LRR and PYD domains-containing protein 12-like isoform X1 [Hemibagrus wyckioides]XP_058272981.1 NACHT, LRR and PYD domains-containing protein 12-like isoform X1 [Hemibagrus wyckioides]XP_058272982.1 NACHT, LRR and PYD domains-containing protein 12-like isoform X1 [Hemibagrus wyckioides]
METPDLDTDNVSPPSKKRKLQGKRSESSAPSCISMKSDESMDPPLDFKDGGSSLLHRFPSGSPVSSHLPNTCHVLQKAGDRREMITTDTGHDPESVAVNEFQKKFKLNLMKKFQCLNGVIINPGTQTLLNEIYTELYITEGDSGEVNNEHEVRQIEAASRRTTTEETPIKCNDIFKPLSEQDEPIRTVLTKGVAGIGKTVSVQKFILDWAEGEENQDIHLIFPLPFRELNLMKDQKLSLMELLQFCFKDRKEAEMSSLEKVLFIFDGLDECRFPLDFQNTVRVCDVTESASVPVLLINLIKGNLLPSALIWITSRPAAADQIPSECVHRVTEVRGFNDPQKEEYFRKRISDQSLANNIITHLKSLRSLYIMCHIPVFCWISATVLERMLGEAESGEIPKTLTQMYTHFLIIQTNIIREKYTKKLESDEEMLLKLGQLAFQQLKNGNLIFYEEDLRECGIDVTEAAVYSGVCTQIFREEFGLHQSKVYCFVHLSIQEHLAALYVFLTFMKKKRNVLGQYKGFKSLIRLNKISDVHTSAIDQALESQTGHLDLFLRFLLGLSLESNQKLLHALVTQTGSSSQSIEETVQYIKKKISEDLPTEKSINLFHCLNELGDNSLVEEIQHYLKSGKQSELSSSQWSALVFVLLTSAQELEEFDLSKYFSTDKITETVVLKMMPVITASRKAIIRCDSLGEKSWSALDSALRSETSSLRELHLTVKTLDLSWNNLGDSGVKSLSAGLENPHCKVETLRLYKCGISDEGCAALTSALRSNPSHLRNLNLSENKLSDSGVKSLSAVLENPHCKLEILGLSECGISDEGSAALTSALRSNPSHLRDLDLSDNNLGASGVKSLSAVLENPHCKLEKLWLCECGISDEGCAALTSALRSNPSHLSVLNLSDNNLGDSGVKSLSAVLENPYCKLEKLWLYKCGISDEGCAALTSALRSNPSHLRDLHLSRNNLSDSGKKLLSALKDDEHYKLQTLMME